MNFNNKNRTLSIKIHILIIYDNRKAITANRFFFSHHLILLILGNLGNSYLILIKIRKLVKISIFMKKSVSSNNNKKVGTESVFLNLFLVRVRDFQLSTYKLSLLCMYNISWEALHFNEMLIWKNEMACNEISCIY